MSEQLIPDGESLRRAVRWIDAERSRRPDRSQSDLIDEAGRRFDLSPLDSEFLLRELARREASGPTQV